MYIYGHLFFVSVLRIDLYFVMLNKLSRKNVCFFILVLIKLGGNYEGKI